MHVYRHGPIKICGQFCIFFFPRDYINMLCSLLSSGFQNYVSKHMFPLQDDYYPSMQPSYQFYHPTILLACSGWGCGGMFWLSLTGLYPEQVNQSANNKTQSYQRTNQRDQSTQEHVSGLWLWVGVYTQTDREELNNRSFMNVKYLCEKVQGRYIWLLCDFMEKKSKIDDISKLVHNFLKTPKTQKI